MNRDKKIYNHKHRWGFTLAEVLITLGIIGVVAALTIPVIMNAIQDAQFKTAYKKAFSVASQAWQQIAGDNMLEPRNGWVSDVSNYDNFSQFMNKFDKVKICTYTDSNIADCWAVNETSDVLYGVPFENNSQQICFIDKSGMTWCNVGSWGYMLVDTNGFKSPNQYGIDRFMIYSTVNGSLNGIGVPNILKPLWQDYTYHDDTYCPAGAKHPCYYIKWLYN